MYRLLTILTALSALLSAAPFIRPRTQAREALLWLPKLLGGALSPLTGLMCAVGAVVGVARRDWKLAAASLLGAGLAARLVAELPDVDQALAGLAALDKGAAPDPKDQAGPPLGSIRALRYAGRAEFERDVVYGHCAESGKALRADLWPSSRHLPSGLGIVFVHGGAWRLGNKDMFTRHFFRRLAGQGHLVLDIAYSLWPTAGLPAMVSQVNQAILWLKQCGPSYGVDPERIVLMGGSAGGHLALMAAYTAGHPAFRPAGTEGDSSVCGVVAFYPPVDLLALHLGGASTPPASSGIVDRISQRLMAQLLAAQEGAAHTQVEEFVAEMLGGSPAQVPEAYRLLSPISHVCAHCPPTLLLQGSDDVFGLAPDTRRLHECLLEAGVPSALLEFPHTEHAFDLLLPQISPTARAGARGVERFLARLP